MNKKVVLELHTTPKKELFLEIPTLPGVYLFLAQDKKPLYVGKAKNLKNRLSSYFLGVLIRKTKEMVKEAKFLSFIKTESEIEALILEANLIKKYQPKYNVIQKDDKSPLYIIITKEKYPRLILGRKSEIKGKNVDRFYGPFLSTRIARNLLRNIRRFIPFSDHKLGKKPCIYSQIGLCNPCPNLIENTKEESKRKELKKDYLRNIRKVKYFLSGNIKKVEKELTIEIKNLAQKQEFEKALEAKNKLETFKYLTSPIRNPDEYLENPNLIEDQREEEVESFISFLSKFFRIKKLRRIECYDVSHTSGAYATASMVVFMDGNKSSRDYKQFRLKRSINNDRESLIEVINRRLKHLKDWGKPDLIIVDGGKPQISAVYPILKRNKIPLIGIAKRFEELVVPILENNQTTYLKHRIKNEKFGNLIIRIRDESHRFAQRYHHKLFLSTLKL